MYEKQVLRRIIPIDWGELLIDFDSGQIRSFEPSKQNLFEDYKFLAYPDKLRSYSFNETQIKWTNGTVFSKEFLFEHTKELEDAKLQWKSLSLGRKNQAPTSRHMSHHVYDVAIRPFNLKMPIALSESIGGGIADSGGSRNINLNEVQNYRDHFELSDCLWAYDKLLVEIESFDKLIDSLIVELLKRNYR